MKNRSEVLACFKDFHKEVQTQYGAVVKVLRYESTSKAFGEYLSSQSIQHQTTYTHQSRIEKQKGRIVISLR
jgi:hypothetical protein